MFRTTAFIGPDVLRVYQSDPNYVAITESWASWSDLHRPPGGGEFVLTQRFDHARREKVLEFQLRGVNSNFEIFQTLHDALRGRVKTNA